MVTSNFFVWNALFFFFINWGYKHCIVFLFPKLKYFFLFPRKIQLYWFAMSHSYISEITTSVSKTQSGWPDWARFHKNCISAELCRFKIRPVASNENSDVKNMKHTEIQLLTHSNQNIICSLTAKSPASRESELHNKLFLKPVIEKKDRSADCRSWNY